MGINVVTLQKLIEMMSQSMCAVIKAKIRVLRYSQTSSPSLLLLLLDIWEAKLEWTSNTTDHSWTTAFRNSWAVQRDSDRVPDVLQGLQPKRSNGPELLQQLRPKSESKTRRSEERRTEEMQAWKRLWWEGQELYQWCSVKCDQFLACKELIIFRCVYSGGLASSDSLNGEMNSNLNLTVPERTVIHEGYRVWNFQEFRYMRCEVFYILIL